MNPFMVTLRRRQLAKKDHGFTLIELLVVITILGILAAIVVFSVAGLGDQGRSTAVTSDATVLRTAEEAYYARNGMYVSTQTLQSAGYLTSQPTYNSVVVTGGGTGFVVGAASSASTTTSGSRILAASNTTGAFSFLQSSFIASNSAVQFLFGASSTLAATANGASDADIAFASADEANVNATIACPTGTTIGGVTCTGPLPAGGSAGTCTASCSGIASTKVDYTTGQLVVFSCKSGATTLPPAGGAGGCKAPAGGFLTSPPTTPAAIVALLNANPTFKLTIANPGADSTLPPTGATPPTAPYGLAAYQALTSSGAGGGGLTDAQYKAFEASGQIIYGSNVTNTQINVETGAAQMALLPKSFVVAPSGNDGNNWTEVTPALHDPIRQWAVVLNHGSTTTQALGQAFLNYVVSPAGQAVLEAFGYDPIS